MEPDQVLHLLRSQQDATLTAHDVKLLHVARSAVLCNQIRLAANSVERPYRFIVLTVRRGDTVEHYYCSYDEWLTKCKLLPPDERHRLVRLDQLLRLVAPSPPSEQPQQQQQQQQRGVGTDIDRRRVPLVSSPASSRSNTLRSSSLLGVQASNNSDNRDNDNDSDTVLLQHVDPIWLDDQWSEDDDDDGPGVEVGMARMIDYLTLLSDFAMMNLEWLQQHSSKGEKRVERKWLRYVDRRARAFGHPRLAFRFLAAHINIRRRALAQDPLLQQWLAMQLYLFRRHKCCSVAGDSEALQCFAQKLASHVAYYTQFPDMVCQWQHGHWHSLTVVPRDGSNNETRYWQSCDESAGYKVSARWLFEDEFAAPVAQGEAAQWPLQQGVVSIPAAVFAQHFLPALYRHVLLDLIHTLLHISDGSGRWPDMWRERHRFHNGNQSVLDTLLYRHLADFPHFETTIYVEVLLDYNVRQQAYASPVTAHMPRHLDEKKKRVAAANQRRGADAGAQVAQLIDIEDLFNRPEQVMPPCLAPVMRQPWFKNDDRLNLVAVLLDMGYANKEDVIGVMCRKRKRDDAFDHATIESLYDGRAKKKKEGQGLNYMGRCSIRCGSIINATFQAGNNIRCPYEADLNGEARRANHSDDEKRKMRTRCGNTLQEGYRVVSPMDYIAFRAKQLAGATRRPQAPPAPTDEKNKLRCDYVANSGSGAI